jgi:2'-5' RNA ligase
MRLFTGIALAPHIVETLSSLLDDLRPTAPISWTPVENLHITCKFIGEWPEDRLADLKAALKTVAIAAPIPIEVTGFGFFPTPHHPRSFFAGVHAGPQLVELPAAIDHALLPLGIGAETRPYRPHITLARMKETGVIRTLRERIAGMTDFDFGAFDAYDFHLYLSKPATRGSVYTKLATYDLMREDTAP